MTRAKPRRVLGMVSVALAACSEGGPEAVVAAPEAEVGAETSQESAKMPVAWTESELTAPGPDGGLAGTLLTPANPVTDSVVLLIAGSGPTDRDGSQRGIAAAPLRDLAHALGERGVPSLRADKRGLGGSADAVANPNEVSLAAYARDAASWIGTLDAPCTVIAGHSEGGLVAIEAADADGVCGIVLLATPGRPLDVVLEEQLRANPANAMILDEALDIMGRIKAGERVEEMNPLLAPLFRPDIQDYMSELLNHDPAKALAGVKIPVLVVGGGRDIQVVGADFDALTAAKPDAQIELYPAMSHLLSDVEEGRVAAMQAYMRVDAPLTEGLADRVAGFAIAAGSTPDG